MKSTHWLLTFALAAVPAVALAQERGRTDGPEGSEYGKGGYSRQNGGKVSLELNWGASFPSLPGNAPLFIGLTGSFWGDEWFLVDLRGAYFFSTQSGHVMVGPRVRTITWPVSAYLGINAGPVFQGSSTAISPITFGLTPHVGADFLVADHVLLGLDFAYDISFGGTNTARIGMNVGYRF